MVEEMDAFSLMAHGSLSLFLLASLSLVVVWLPSGIFGNMAWTIMIPFLQWPRLPLFVYFSLWMLCTHDPFFQLDIKNAFLHNDLAKEVYIEQPPGFVAQGESGLVGKLCRSLYCLKQSPRAWFSRFSLMVQEIGMIRRTTDHSVFYHHTSTSQRIYLIVYVDDIVITGSDQDGIRKFKQHLFSHFQTKDLGKLKYFLGIEVAQSNSGVVISQRKCTLDILTDIGMLDCKLVDTLLDPNVKLIPG